MKFIVSCKQDGAVFTEEVHASDGVTAKKVAEARNPGATAYTYNTPSWNDSGNSSSSSVSLGDFGNAGGMVALAGILFVLWLIVEFWWLIVPLAIIGAILYYFAIKEDS